jgi:hypothetical protein
MAIFLKIFELLMFTLFTFGVLVIMLVNDYLDGPRRYLTSKLVSIIIWTNEGFHTIFHTTFHTFKLCNHLCFSFT